MRLHGASLFFPLLLAATLVAACGTGISELPGAVSPEVEPEARLSHPDAKKARALLHSTLIRTPELAEHFSIGSRGIAVYATVEDRRQGQVEHFLHWQDVKTFRRILHGKKAAEALALYLAKGDKPYPAELAGKLPPLPGTFSAQGDPERPLTGLRVALDPGHIGGSQAMARLESRSIEMPADPDQGLPEAMAFGEGHLAICIALLLREKLETAGAEVLLSRDASGLGAAGLDFDTWLKEGYPRAQQAFFQERKMGWRARRRWRRRATRSEIFHRVFKHQDFRLRAAKINAFRPHLTLILHLNVDETLWKDGRPQTPGEKNFNLAFVPGAFLAGELRRAEDRLLLLARLVGPDLERSIAFSDAVVRGLVSHTGVPALERASGQRYLEKSLATEAPGVWARNLALTRQILGTLSFGESLFQDSLAEVRALNRRDLRIAGHDCSPRLRDVAAGYFAAIEETALAGGAKP